MDDDRKVMKEKFVVDSSLIEYMIYDYPNSELEVKYKKGKHKVYPDFSKKDLDDILSAISPGKELLRKLGKNDGENPKKKKTTGFFSFFLGMFG